MDEETDDDSSLGFQRQTPNTHNPLLPTPIHTLHTHRKIWVIQPAAWNASAVLPGHWLPGCGDLPGTACSSFLHGWLGTSGSSHDDTQGSGRSWRDPRRCTSRGSLESCSGSCWPPGSLPSPGCGAGSAGTPGPAPAEDRIKLFEQICLHCISWWKK